MRRLCQNKITTKRDLWGEGAAGVKSKEIAQKKRQSLANRALQEVGLKA